ncbi:hypothetical protein DRO32_04990, partial [Candidatus Bathyarchaeota archaeon]
FIVLRAGTYKAHTSALYPGEVIYGYDRVGPNSIVEVSAWGGEGTVVYVLLCPPEKIWPLLEQAPLNTTVLKALVAQEDVEVLSEAPIGLHKTFSGFGGTAILLVAVSNEGHGICRAELSMAMKVRLVPLERSRLASACLFIVGLALSSPYAFLKMRGRGGPGARPTQVRGTSALWPRGGRLLRT